MVEKQGLIKRELQLNNVKLLHLPSTLREAVLDELAICLYPDIHEQRMAPYGAVICARHLHEPPKARLIPITAGEIGRSRRFADGRRSFLIYYPSGEHYLGIFDLAFGEEYRLLQLSRAVSGIVLQRQQAGLVKLVQNGEIYIVRGRTWSHKESIMEVSSRILSCLGKAPITNPEEIVFGLLRVCYHYLSPEGVGATLVWHLADTGEATSHADTGISLHSLSLSVHDVGAYSLIRHILRHEDGATFVTSTGELRSTGVHLLYSDKATKAVPEIRGTRHTSAARFTYDHTDTIAFVVSQDGPVTVFSDGANIAELPVGSAVSEAEWLKKVGGRSKSQDISSTSFAMQCKSCKRHIRIEEVTVLGWKDPEQVSCPVCGKELYSAMCFSLKAYPIKFAD